MSKILVIVESPAKARKIQKFLGSKYVVKASLGHIYDLPQKKLGIDLKTFKMEHVPMIGKKKIIAELKKSFLQCKKQVILAPDPDREGEAIAYHVAKCLGIDPFETPRISFTEITKGAILNAIKSPTTLNESAVRAQMARRSLDRILGYKISPHVKKATLTGTSAGRCQSPALLLLQQKEDEIREFCKHKEATIRGKMRGTAQNDSSGPWEVMCGDMKEFPKENLFTKRWIIKDSKKSKPIRSNPPPPFITSTLLSSAANRLGMGTGRVKKMMQSMYEKGWITYIRTDSTAISKSAQAQISEYLREELDETVVSRDWDQKKGAHAQEAHECIRPTLIKRLPADIDMEFRRLYELIWNRTVASQMEAAESVVVKLDVTYNKHKYVWTGSKSYCVKPGWKTIEGETAVKSGDIQVPKKKGLWEPEEIVVEEYVATPPRRLTDATFVSLLEKKGIGRPSTYSSIIETIKSRGYAEVRDCDGQKMELRRQVHPTKTSQLPRDETVETDWGRENRRLMLTDLGGKVCDYVYPQMDSLLGISMTAEMEAALDKIAQAKTTYEDTMSLYWKQLSSLLTTLSEQTTTVKRSNIGTQMIAGKKYDITFENTRYGPAVVRSKAGSNKEYGNIPKGTDVSSLSLEEALKLLPTKLGTWKKQSVVAKQGKFGPYLQVGDKKPRYVSIPKEIWDKGISKEQAATLLRNVEQEESHATSLIKSHASVKDIKKGPRGWYAILKTSEDKKRTKTVSLGDDIQSVSADSLRDMIA